MVSMDNEFPQTAKPSQVPLARVPLERTERWMMFMGSVGLMVILCIAAWLRPDPAGLGTHRQLGLPGCTLYTIVGIRCPGCGMTTSWAHTMNGNLSMALRANSAGTLFLCLLSIVLAPCMFSLACRGISSYHGLVVANWPCTIDCDRVHCLRGVDDPSSVSLTRLLQAANGQCFTRLWHAQCIWKGFLHGCKRSSDDSCKFPLPREVLTQFQAGFLGTHAICLDE